MVSIGLMMREDIQSYNIPVIKSSGGGQLLLNQILTNCNDASYPRLAV